MRGEAGLTAMDMGRADQFNGRRAGTAALPQDGLRLISSEALAEPAFVNEWQRLTHNAAEPNPFFEPWFLLP